MWKLRKWIKSFRQLFKYLFENYLKETVSPNLSFIYPEGARFAQVNVVTVETVFYVSSIFPSF